MEIQNVTAVGQLPVQAEIATAPPAAQPDGRVSADAAASTKEPSPEIPLPIPASPSQTGLVSKAAIEDKETAPILDSTGTSAVQRTLLPYGISMLPERQDAPKHEAPSES
ncbi:MAG: hypothetical protein ACSHWY_08915 [Octadecabacter sp.]